MNATEILDRNQSLLPGIHIWIIGGKRLCKAFFKIIYCPFSESFRPKILGVADPDCDAEGIQYAQEHSIFTTDDPAALCRIEGMDLLLDLKGEEAAFKILQESKPASVKLLNRLEAQLLIDLLRIEEWRLRIQNWRNWEDRDSKEITRMFLNFLDAVPGVARERNAESRNVRNELTVGKQAMAQIIQVSTAPTFVINNDHIVTHWNRACEKLTGYRAEDMVGASDHWKPFRSTKRPTMADLVVEEVNEEDAFKYYCTQWRKSALIEGAYETEEYFHHLGEEGKWLFFTAAPIKASDGGIVGAIETLWDKTEERRAQRQLESYTKELALP